MQRRPTTQDISWLLDLDRNKQLDLNPPYQRKSVWTPSDQKFFLDTIFRNYPSPAIFLHKTIDESGKTTYHVVDGKQRTQTILEFVNDRIRIGSDFGDIRLDGKKWSDLTSEPDLRRQFWNYQLTVELIDFDEISLVNQVFDRLNRNARRLTNQELRHAKFGGWFAQEAEREAIQDEWRELGVVTAARSKRMADVQFISELMLVVIENRMHGFDQDALDAAYAQYDSLSELEAEFDLEDFTARFERARRYLSDMARVDANVARFSRALGNVYSLWSLVVLETNLPEPAVLADRYTAFMRKVETLSAQDNIVDFMQGASEEYADALRYLNALRGANTDLTPRTERFEALRRALLNQQ
ncbi:DUF262 domain-containing protein [Microvirga makkahensis]|uniref:DUF262 domain-containing protein n=1 Tax=Microvirga makkahensis TaxID=1128670 RepID=A0A7X3MQ61_9HYPH|nr:DUF262 domain-containing protein [Microvirga makkahensis]MXQ11186.1 DUF262 domain-containing protein [Microvirga makkahensis]